MTPRRPAPDWHAWARLFLSPRGRVDRDTYSTSYWIVLVGFGACALVGEELTFRIAPSARWLVFATVGLIAWWSWLAISIKRAHDLDETGWSVVLGGWRLLTQPGTVGPNRYGSPTQSPYARRRWSRPKRRARPSPPRRLEERTRAVRRK